MSKLNYVNRLLVAKSGAVVGTSLQTITPGDILFVKADGTVLTNAAAAALGDTEAIYAAMGVALGVPRLSSPLRRSDFRQGGTLAHFTRQPFRPATQQIDEITADLVAGKHYRIRVLLKDELKVIANRPTMLEITDFVATGDDAADLAKLAARITKFRATYGMLKGSVVAGKLRVEGLPVPSESVLDQYQFVAFGTSFVEMDPLAQGQSSGTPFAVATIQKADGGSGLGVQLQEIERMADGYLGNTDLRSWDRKSNVSRVNPVGEYDLIHLLTLDKHQGDHEFTMESPVQTTFALPAGSALATSVETFLKAFLFKDAAATTTSAPDPDDANA